MHSERQVTCLKESKKVVLFLVEGVTDETAFGYILSKIIEEQNVVRFKIIGGDITSQSGTNAKNCINRIVDQVKEFLAQDIYQKSDLLEIIHLVDLDGAFISNEHVVDRIEQLPKGLHVYYTLDDIITDRVESILQRNQKKSEVLSKLIATKEIYGKISYQIYFFSCNMEHVFINEQNLRDDEKYPMAKELETRFADAPEEFIAFLNSEEIAVKEGYEQSWQMMKQNEESLKRHSNFHLYLNQCVEEKHME